MCNEQCAMCNVQTINAQIRKPQKFIINKCVFKLNTRLDIGLRLVAEFKEFERRFKFKPRLKYALFHLILYQMFQDLIRRLI